MPLKYQDATDKVPHMTKQLSSFKNLKLNVSGSMNYFCDTTHLVVG